jgi:PPOX class probable F420-dependent enzyme
LGTSRFERGSRQFDQALLTLPSANALDEATCLALVERTGHGVLATVHAARGVDVVPVVFALEGGRIVVPVDTLKPKRSTDLQRVKNLEADPRCVLLVEHYSEDWDELWWVRIHAAGSLCGADDLEIARSALAGRHLRYAAEGSVVSAIVLTPNAITGWQARPGS